MLTPIPDSAKVSAVFRQNGSEEEKRARSLSVLERVGSSRGFRAPGPRVGRAARKKLICPPRWRCGSATFSYLR